MPDFVKQIVQWYPGHMAKSKKRILKDLQLVDGVVEIIDARIPMSSRNPDMNSLIERKPHIILLNKADLADESITKEWMEYYKSKGIYSAPVNCKNGKGLNAFNNLVNTALCDVINRNKERFDNNKPIKLMVVGIPNCGKSSFINRMAKKNKAVVANKAGVTKDNQWYTVNDRIMLLDTPGMLWPKFNDDIVGNNLAFTGAISSNAYDIETISVRLIEMLINNYPNALNDRYSIGSIDGLMSYEVLELIGKKRGFVIKGGEIDYERTANTLVDEFRSGQLGRISIEKP